MDRLFKYKNTYFYKKIPSNEESYFPIEFQMVAAVVGMAEIKSKIVVALY